MLLRAAPPRTALLGRPRFDNARRPISDADSDFKDCTFTRARRLAVALSALRRTLVSLLFFLEVEEAPDIFVPDDEDADFLGRRLVL